MTAESFTWACIYMTNCVICFELITNQLQCINNNLDKLCGIKGIKHTQGITHQVYLLFLPSATFIISFIMWRYMPGVPRCRMFLLVVTVLVNCMRRSVQAFKEHSPEAQWLRLPRCVDFQHKRHANGFPLALLCLSSSLFLHDLCHPRMWIFNEHWC